MDGTTRSAILRIAREVRSAQIARLGKVDGSCKEVSIAIALRMAEVDLPVCVCVGRIKGHDTEHAHYWNRIDCEILDATPDQFGSSHPLVFDDMRNLPQYDEHSYVVFNPSSVMQLIEASRTLKAVEVLA